MITLIAPALLVSGLFVQQQQTIHSTMGTAPAQYIAEFMVFGGAGNSFKLNGEQLTDSVVISPDESTEIEFSQMSTGPMVRTLAGMPASVGTTVRGRYTGYRVMIVPDGDDLLVSFRHMTWRQEKDSSVELDKTVLKAVAEIMQSGGTWFVRLDEDSIVSIKITEDAQVSSQDKSVLQSGFGDLRDREVSPEMRARLEVASTFVAASKSSFENGEYALAERSARNGLNELPTSLSLKKWRGEALMEVSESMQRRGSPPGSMTEVSLLTKIVDTYVQASRSAFKEGNYAVAERAARNGLAVVPNDLRLLSVQGEPLLRLGLYSEALRVIKEVNDSQRDTGSYARIGLLMALLGQVQESFNMTNSGALESVIPSNLKGTVPIPRTTRDLQAYWLLTIANEAERGANDEQSVFYYKEALKIWPRHVMPNYRLGKIYWRKQRYQEAADCFGKITAGPERVLADARMMHTIALVNVERGGG